MNFVNCPTYVESDKLQQALLLLVKRHDSLRLRFSRLEEGGWKSEITDECDGYGFKVVNTAGLTDVKKDIEISKAYEVMAEKSNITQGPLIQATLFDNGHDKPSDVLLFVHHYAVDMLAFEFLIQELLNIYEQLLENNSVKLPQVGLSYYDYTKLARDYCLSDTCIKQVDYWTNLIEKDLNELPLDHDNQNESIWHSRRVFGSLSAENTERLLTISKRYREFQIVDILLASLLITCIQWTTKSHLYICFQDYGRSMSIERENLYDFVGWISTFYPMTLKYQENCSINIY